MVSCVAAYCLWSQQVRGLPFNELRRLAGRHWALLRYLVVDRCGIYYHCDKYIMHRVRISELVPMVSKTLAGCFASWRNA